MYTDLYATDWHGQDISEDADNDDDRDDDDSGSSGGSSASKSASKIFTCKNKFIIKAFCLNEKGSSIVLNINNFQPYFFIKIPCNWQPMNIEVFITGLKSKVKKYHVDTLVSWKAVNAKPLYGFTAQDKFKYLRLNFSCLSGFYKYREVLNEKIRIFGLHEGQAHKYEQFESNLPPLLRFLHCYDIKPAGWLKVKDLKYSICNSTTCDAEATVGVEALNAVEREDLPPIECVAFDIECDSSHGDFPIAKKDYHKLARDIVMDYNLIKGDKIYNDMRPVLAIFLKYAFHPYYNNNNIKSVTLLDEYYPSVTEILSNAKSDLTELIEYWAPHIYKIFLSGESNRELLLLDIFGQHFPLLHESSDYYGCCQQLIMEHSRLTKNNDQVYRRHPIKVTELLLTLMFDPYYKNISINKLYNKGAVPSYELLQNLIPCINNICNEAYVILSNERRATRYRKCGIKKKRKDLIDINESVDKQVSKLNEVLNQYLPSVSDDPVIQIGSTFKKYGAPDCHLKHIICLKGCEPITNQALIDFEFDGTQYPDKDILDNAKKMGLKMPDKDSPTYKADLKALGKEVLEIKIKEQYKTDKAQVIVESYETEEEVLLAWQKLIVRQNPDIVMGYNTFGFDFKYMYDRAEQLGIVEEFSQLGRIKGVKQKLIKQELQSAAFGQNEMFYIEMTGRILIDLYKVMQRMFQLNSYKLDFVSKKFMFKSKVDISPAEIFVKQKGNDRDRREVAQYCLIDCILCNRLMDKLELLINNIGMAQVCSVPLSFLFSRGQGIKLFSFLAKVCRQEGYLITVLGEPLEEGKYEGAVVLDPDKNIHETVTVVGDFNSLYPSCIISENLSHDSFVSSIVVKKGESKDYRNKCMGDTVYEKKLIAGDYLGWDYVDIDYDVYEDVPVAPGRKKKKKIVVGHKICRFAQPPNGGKGVIPKILIDLLTAREKSKDMRDTFPKYSFRWNIYEGLQLAYKVTANSLYGIMGASTSQIRFKEIAACTTATGRKLINFSADYVLKNYKGSKITYGDTDSIFIQFDCRDRYGNKLYGLDAINKSIMLCKEAALCISKQLKPPHNLEFEKAIFPFILLSKKRYHGHYYTKYGVPEYEAKSMGIVLKRRDNAPIVKHVFGGMIDIIMKEHSISKAIEFVQVECRKVLAGEFPMDMFIIAKTLRSYYKTPDSIAHNVLAQRIGKRDPGNKPRGNDRIEYVFIVNPDAETQGDRIETPEYATKHKCKLDYGYYITNQISKPVLQIFDLVNKGSNLFESLLRDYYAALEGLGKISSDYSCIRMLDRKNIFNVKSIKDLWEDTVDKTETDTDAVTEADIDDDTGADNVGNEGNEDNEDNDDDDEEEDTEDV